MMENRIFGWKIGRLLACCVLCLALCCTVNWKVYASDYILADSDSRYLTAEDVAGLSLREINYAKNEIFARRGRKFNSVELQTYFNSKSWYTGLYEPADFDENYMANILNDYEKVNAEFLAEAEHAIDPNGYSLDTTDYSAYIETETSIAIGEEESVADSSAENTAESAGQVKESGNVMMADEGACSSFGNSSDNVLGSSLMRGEISTITFLDSLSDMPSDAWDVSAERNGAVMAWAIQSDNTEETMYDLYIAGEGGVDANPYCGGLFSSYKNLISIDFNNSFYTGNSTDMNWMFNNCSGLTTLDLSSFDTSQVTDMNSMFYRCSGLTTLDLSNFDTSQVTDMEGMFTHCVGLTTLDVSSFDTSQVTDMSGMFYDCSGLTALDVSGFDTSQVKYMSYLFYDCSSLTSLDLSGFDMSQANTDRMFTGTIWED